MSAVDLAELIRRAKARVSGFRAHVEGLEEQLEDAEEEELDDAKAELRRLLAMEGEP